MYRGICCLTAVLFLYLHNAAFGVPATFTNLVNSSGTFSSLSFIPTQINGSGQVVFRAFLDDSTHGAFMWNGASIVPVATTGVTFSSIALTPDINDSGVVLFTARLAAGGDTIYSSQGGVLTPLANSGTTHFSLSRAVINNVGDIAYVAWINNLSSSREVYKRSSGGTVTKLADPFAYQDIGDPVINNAGAVYFKALLHDSVTHGLYSGLDPLADRFVDNTGSFGLFGSVLDANNSTVVFPASIDGSLREGIFKGSNPVTDLFAGGPSTFFFQTIQYSAAVNDLGQIAYVANPSPIGIYVGPNTATDYVIRVGDPLFGATVISLGSEIDINNAGQISFSYMLNNGVSGIAIAQIPEPAAMAGGLLFGMAMLVRRRF